MPKHTISEVQKSLSHSDFFFEQTPFSLEDHSTGVTGTPDSTWNPKTAFTYEGAFKIPYQDMGSGVYLSTRDTESFCYDPATNSFWLCKIENNVVMLSQFDNPTPSMSTDVDQLPESTRLQGFTEIAGDLIDTPDFDIDNSGFLQVIGDRMFVGAYDDYNQRSNPYNLLIVDGISDLSTATTHGYVNLKVGADNLGDLGATISFQIPAEHQSDFGGHTSGIACGNHVSISGRWDYGHSFCAWTPTDIEITDLVYDQVVKYMHHPQANPIGGWSDNNDDLTNYYHSYFCDPATLPMHAPNNNDAYLYLPESQKLTFEQVQKLPRPQKDVYTNVAGWETGARCAFIPPNSNTIVYVGEVIGASLGRIYKGRNLEYTGPQNTAAGPEPVSKKDFNNCIWCVNLDDIKNAQNLDEPQYNYFGNFAENWLEYSYDSTRGRISRAFYDHVNSKLYVLHAGIYNPQNKTQTRHIVSVYSVAGGSA